MSEEFLKILQPIIHYSLHFLFPGLIGYIFFREHWKKAWLIMIATMMVDLDHLFSTPIFDPGRCSINHHFLHTYYAMAGYFHTLIFSKNKDCCSRIAFPHGDGLAGLFVVGIFKF